MCVYGVRGVVNKHTQDVWVSYVAITNDHKFSDLKYTFILLAVLGMRNLKWFLFD